MNAPYEKIIPLLQHEMDWKTMCFQLAAHHPFIFQSIYNDVHCGGVRNKVIGTLNGDRANKIRAIKVYRELTNTTLKDGLDYVNDLINELNLP